MTAHRAISDLNEAIDIKAGVIDLQDTGLKSDVIAESTAAAGVTIDGVLLKDGDVTGDVIGNVTGNVTGDIDAANAAIDALTAEIATFSGDADHIASGTVAESVGAFKRYHGFKTVDLSTPQSSVAIRVLPVGARLESLAFYVSGALSAAAVGSAQTIGLRLSTDTALLVGSGVATGQHKEILLSGIAKQAAEQSLILAAVRSDGADITTGRIGKAGARVGVDYTYVTVGALSSAS